MIELYFGLFYSRDIKIRSWKLIIYNLHILLFMLSIQSSLLVIGIGLLWIFVNRSLNEKNFILGIWIQIIGLLCAIPYTEFMYLKLICVIFCMIGIGLQFGSFYYKLCRANKSRDIFEFIVEQVMRKIPLYPDSITRLGQ